MSKWISEMCRNFRIPPPLDAFESALAKRPKNEAKSSRIRPKWGQIRRSAIPHIVFTEKKTQTKWGWQFQIAISIKRRYMSSSWHVFCALNHTQPLEKGHFLNNKDQIDGSSRQDFFRQNIRNEKITQNSIERLCFVLKVKRQAFTLSCFYSMTFGLWAQRACLELSPMAKKLSNLFSLTWVRRGKKKVFEVFNLFVTSKKRNHEFTNSRI